MEFPGVLKKQQVEFPIKNNVEFPRDDQEKMTQNFQGSQFQALKFMRGVTEFCGDSKGKALFCLEFPGIK